jgi:hypothetical protein
MPIASRSVVPRAPRIGATCVPSSATTPERARRDGHGRLGQRQVPPARIGTGHPAMTHAPYVTHLLALATRTRDPLRLAVAFRAQHPEWGARATYTAYGLRDLLDHLGWPLDATLPRRFESFAQELADAHPEPLWALRRSQVRQLLALIERPQPFTLRQRGGAPGVDAALAPLLVACADRGLTLADVRHALGIELGLSRSGLVGAGDAGLTGLVEALAPWQAEVCGLELGRYVDVLRRSDRDHHPDVLRAATLRDLAALGRASMPSPEQRLEASLAELVEHDDDDAFVSPPRGGAMQA